MKKSTALRWFLALQWGFVVSGLIVSSAMQSSLPEPLRDWLQAQAEGGLTLTELILGPVYILLLIAIVVATVGLFCLQRWGAWLYLGTSIAGTLCLPLTGPTVESPLAYMLDEIGVVMSGLVIALAFFTDSLKKSGGLEPPKLPANEPAP